MTVHTPSADPFAVGDVDLALLGKALATGMLAGTVARPKLAALWGTLQSPPNGLSSKQRGAWKRQRGFTLEKLLIGLAMSEGLETEHPFRTKGEQVDGLIVIDNRALLLEAKWHDDELPASSIYAFQGKLRGKIVGTLGVFVSIKGFSKDAIEAVPRGKPVDVVLATGADIALCFDEGRSLGQMLRMKLRKAARDGEVHYSYQRWIDESTA
jgi:hypothetical protein